MDLAFLFFAAPICIADLATFRIPNVYTKVLLYLACIHFFFVGLGSLINCVITIGFLLGLFFMKMGMGDLKILGLILLTHSFDKMTFIIMVVCIAGLHILVLSIVQRELPKKVAAAPSIFIGLATYLVTR